MGALGSSPEPAKAANATECQLGCHGPARPRTSQLGLCAARRHVPGAARRGSLDPRRRVRHHRGALGLRQEHAPDADRRAAAADRRCGAARRPGGDRAGSRPRPGVSGFRPAAVAHRARQCGAWPRAQGRAGAEARRDRTPAHRHGGPFRLRAILSAPIVRRHAPARRHRARARGRAAGAADGRAVRGARRADPPGDGVGAAAHLGARPQDHPVRHPRHRRVDLSRRPHHRDERLAGPGHCRHRGRRCSGRARSRSATIPPSRPIAQRIWDLLQQEVLASNSWEHSAPEQAAVMPAGAAT